MKQKTFILVCCMLFSVCNIEAQNEKSSYASVALNVGMTSLGYSVTELDGSPGSAKSKIGAGVTAKYNYYFNSHWGIGAGFGLSLYKSDAIINGGMNNFYPSGNYIDDDESGLPQNFELRGRLENIKEKQNVQLFEIPVTALYQTRFSYGKWGAYGSLGIKLQLPVVKKFEVASNTESKLNVSGYYTDGTQGFDMGAPGTPELSYHGFGTVANPGKALGWKNDTELKVGFACTFEAGAIHRLNNESDLLFGLYIDYTFSDIKNSNVTLLSGPSGNYHPDANDNIGKGIIYNGLLNSNQTNEITPLSFGVKIGLRFKL